MSGRLSFLPGEVSLAGIPVVTTNSEKSAEVIVAKKKKKIFSREGLNNSKRQFEMYVSSSNPDKVRNRSVIERKHRKHTEICLEAERRRDGICRKCWKRY